MHHWPKSVPLEATTAPPAATAVWHTAQCSNVRLAREAALSAYACESLLHRACWVQELAGGLHTIVLEAQPHRSEAAPPVSRGIRRPPVAARRDNGLNQGRSTGRVDGVVREMQLFDRPRAARDVPRKRQGSLPAQCVLVELENADGDAHFQEHVREHHQA